MNTRRTIERTRTARPGLRRAGSRAVLAAGLLFALGWIAACGTPPPSQSADPPPDYSAPPPYEEPLPPPPAPPPEPPPEPPPDSTTAESGDWLNVDPNTGSVTRVLLQPADTSGAKWMVHVWGSCTPTDCDWSWTSAQRQPNGELLAVYDFGFAVQTLHMALQATVPDSLWVHMLTDFADWDGRTDYTSDDVFVRAP